MLVMNRDILNLRLFLLTKAEAGVGGVLGRWPAGEGGGRGGGSSSRVGVWVCVCERANGFGIQVRSVFDVAALEGRKCMGECQSARLGAQKLKLAGLLAGCIGR